MRDSPPLHSPPIYCFNTDRDKYILHLLYFLTNTDIWSLSVIQNAIKYFNSSATWGAMLHASQNGASLYAEYSLTEKVAERCCFLFVAVVNLYTVRILRDFYQFLGEAKANLHFDVHYIELLSFSIFTLIFWQCPSTYVPFSSWFYYLTRNQSIKKSFGFDQLFASI